MLQHRKCAFEIKSHCINIYRNETVQNSLEVLTVFLFFWHAPLGVRSAIHRRHPPQRAVLGQVDCFIQYEVVGSQIVLDGIQPYDMRTPLWSLPGFWWESRMNHLGICFIHAICPNMERRCDWIIAVRLGCLVILLTSSLQTNWCHLIPSSASQAPLVKSINPVCIHLGDCPAFRSV